MFIFFNFPNYCIRKIELLIEIKKLKYKELNVLIIDNLILICDCSFIYFYVWMLMKVDYIKLNLKKGIDIVNLFEIDKTKILLSTNLKGIIVNIKTRQIETYINNFANIFCREKIGKFLLVGTRSKIWQINIRKGELYNGFSDNYYFNGCFRFISSIIDIGNNQFCLQFYDDYIYIFNYN